MKKIMNEDFSVANEEPSSQAAAQAQQLGLTYVGFGRYADPKTNQVAYIVQNDQLVPFKKAIQTTQYRTKQSDDIGNFINQFSEETQIANNILSQAYPPTNYDENELAALQQFTSQSYADINDMLSNLPAGISLKELQPSGPNDTLPSMIATLDSAMKRSRSPIDFNTYIKLDSDVAQIQLTPGNQFKFKGYKSVSIDMSQVLTPDESKVSILQIMVRKNSRGIYTSNYSENQDGEFILPRGAKIEVLSGPTRLVGSDSQTGGNKEIYYYECQTKS